jgi:S-formylglutathione hydrolase FrmB
MSATVFAASPVAKIETRQIASTLLNRTVNYDVILPAGYDESNWRYPVLYLMQGLGGHYDSWIIATNVATFAAKHKMIIVTPEGNDGWWTDSATDKNDKYESYIVSEMLPVIDKNYRTLPFQKYRGIAGASMGGYGALKFGVKYPDKFAFAASLSGALDAATAVETATNQPWTPGMWSFCKPSLMQVFGAAGSLTRKNNDVLGLYRDYPADKLVGLPYIYADCGVDDPFFSANLEFVAILRDRKIPHEFRERPGSHTWYYWNEQIGDVLTIAEKTLKS